jgi:hypothetical protein
LEKVASAVSAKVDKSSAGARRAARSVLGALAYADLFDYPLSLAEIVRYQIDTRLSLEEIASCLNDSKRLARAIARSDDGFYALAGRETVFATRRERATASVRIWARAHTYARLLARFPFVRMIAVTGALAVNNIAEKPDIDLLVVTAPGRVWITRRLIVAVVRLARILKDDLCPNYIISEDNLGLDQRDLFTAHELAQMVPRYGFGVYERMLAENDWATKYLPAAFEEPRHTEREEKRSWMRRGLERLLALGVFDRWERWEMRRLQRKLRPKYGESAEVICSPDQCKGHTGLHRHWITTRYEQRLHELDLV